MSETPCTCQAHDKILSIVNEITLNLMGQRECLLKGILDTETCPVLLGDQIDSVDNLITKLMTLISEINSSYQKDN